MICLRRRWTRRLRRSPVAAAALAAAGVNSPRLVGVKSTNFRTRDPPPWPGDRARVLDVMTFVKISVRGDPG
jgi:hypothetical protein